MKALSLGRPNTEDVKGQLAWIKDALAKTEQASRVVDPVISSTIDTSVAAEAALRVAGDSAEASARVTADSSEATSRATADSLLEAGTPYASTDAVVAATIPTRANILVAQGDASGARFPTPALLEYVASGTPAASWVESGGRRFAYKGRRISLDLCGAVEGNGTKDDAAWAKAVQHLVDYGGGIIDMGTKVRRSSSTIHLTQNDSGVIGAGMGLAQFYLNHNGAAFKVGTETANTTNAGNAATPDRISRAFFLNFWAQQLATNSAVHPLIQAVNVKQLVLDGIRTTGIPQRYTLGEKRQFADLTGLLNDVQFVCDDRGEFNAVAGTYAGDAIDLNSGSVLILGGRMKFNGVGAAGKVVIRGTLTYANWDGVWVLTGCVAEQWVRFAQINGHGIGNYVECDGVIADRNIEGHLDFSPSADISRKVFIGDIIASDDNNANATNSSQGIVINPTGGATVQEARIRGSYRKFGKEAVYVRNVTDLKVDISAVDCGIFANNTYPAVDIATCDHVRVDAVSAWKESGGPSNAHKNAVKINAASVTKFIVGDVQSTGHGTSAIDIVTALANDQFVRDGSFDPAFLVVPSAQINNVTGDGTNYTVIWDSELFDIGGNFNNTTGIFTAPIKGLYQFDIAIQLSTINAAVNRILVILVTSNRNYSSDLGDIPPDTNLRVTASLSALADMDPADTASVIVAAYNDTKVVDILASGTSWWSGRLAQRLN